MKKQNFLTATRTAKKVFFLLIFCLTACSAYDDIANLDSRGESIVCLGDSITAGVGAERDKDFPSVLGEIFFRTVINAGVPGDTTSDALARLERDVFPHNPRIVIILLGGNDFLRKLPKETTRKNLDEIVRRVREAGAIAVVVGIKLDLGDSYGEIFKEISQKRNALYIPNITKGIFGNHSLMSDSVHPNAEGYGIMAKKIASELRPLLDAADKARK